MNQFPNKNYFTMPNEIFSLGLDASEIAVYAYLRCLENRSTYQCWPSYTTIGNAVGRAKNTVMRYVDALAEKGLVSIEPTSVLMKSGIKKNGNLLRRKQKPSNPNSKFFSLLLDAAITNREAYRYSVRTSNRAAQPSGAATPRNSDAHHAHRCSEGFLRSLGAPPAKAPKRQSTPFYPLATQGFRNV